MGQDRKAESRDWIKKARAVNPKSLEAIAIEGALAYVDGDITEYQALAAEALKIHPTYGETTGSREPSPPATTASTKRWSRCAGPFN
jgi:hypothetical protein